MNEYEVRQRFLRRLYAKGKLSMADMYAHLEPKIGYEEAVEAALFLENAVYDLQEPVILPVGEPLSPPLVPAGDLTEKQQEVLEDWQENGSCDWLDAHGEGRYAVLDSIPWKFGPGWRQRYKESRD